MHAATANISGIILNVITSTTTFVSIVILTAKLKSAYTNASLRKSESLPIVRMLAYTIVRTRLQSSSRARVLKWTKVTSSVASLRSFISIKSRKTSSNMGIALPTRAQCAIANTCDSCNVLASVESSRESRRSAIKNISATIHPKDKNMLVTTKRGAHRSQNRLLGSQPLRKHAFISKQLRRKVCQQSAVSRAATNSEVDISRIQPLYL
mmetsp:Transcript_61079/g.122466  ORF Transcript_61079/g.122466 Transcript_61079/m.122466 type:complete len:209 (-) Transcript_61079:28-654(-)